MTGWSFEWRAATTSYSSFAKIPVAAMSPPVPRVPAQLLHQVRKIRVALCSRSDRVFPVGRVWLEVVTPLLGEALAGLDPAALDRGLGLALELLVPLPKR